MSSHRVQQINKNKIRQHRQRQSLSSRRCFFPPKKSASRGKKNDGIYTTPSDGSSQIHPKPLWLFLPHFCLNYLPFQHSFLLFIIQFFYISSFILATLSVHSFHFFCWFLFSPFFCSVRGVKEISGENNRKQPSHVVSPFDT